MAIVSLSESGYSNRQSHCWPTTSMSIDSAASSASASRASPVMTTPKRKIASASAPRAAPTRPITPRPAVSRRGSGSPSPLALNRRAASSSPAISGIPIANATTNITQ